MPFTDAQIEAAHDAWVDACYRELGGREAMRAALEAAAQAAPAPDVRGRFERYYGHGFNLTRADWGDGYKHDGIDAMWKGWSDCARALEVAAQAAPAADLQSALELAWSHCNPFQVPDTDIEIIETALAAERGAGRA